MIDLRQLLPSAEVRACAHCTVEGCSAPTREGKPWCPEHAVEHSPYAQRIAREWDRRRRAEKGGPLPENLLRDAAQLVRDRGTASFACLSRFLDVEAGVVPRIVDALVSRGGYRQGRTWRGQPCVGVRGAALHVPRRASRAPAPKPAPPAPKPPKREREPKATQWVHLSQRHLIAWLDQRPRGKRGVRGGARQLAEAVGVTYAAVVSWRAGRTVPRLSVQERLARVLRESRALSA